MKIKDLKIKTQLIISLVSLLLVVITTGTIAYFHGARIHEQAELLHAHPFEVRNAVGVLRNDIISIQRDMRDLFLTLSDMEKNRNLMQILHTSEDASSQIALIRSLYLGPNKDVDSLNNAFVKWNDMRLKAIDLLDKGQEREAASMIRNFGDVGIQADRLFSRITIVDDFARAKSIELVKNSENIVVTLNRRLIAIVAFFLVVTILIFNILVRNIRKPLDELQLVTTNFHKGDLSARSSYEQKNEFGVLSDSLNSLTDSLQHNIELKNKTEILERIMLTEDDAGSFFRIILGKIVEMTDAQMGAVYLLSDDQKRYEHFISIGFGEKARKYFEASNGEGEFGKAIATGKVQHIKEIADSTRFLLNTTGGTFIPAEIITIPIHTGENVTAVISLASVGRFGKQALELIDEILVSLSVRIEGILAYRKVLEMSERLEFQNKELGLQKTELLTQSAMLTEQNTELEVQKKQLAEANRLKTNFLSNMSHELRTPLNSVIALTGVLGRRLAGKIPEEEYSYLDVIGRNGKHLLLLINDILDISRIEAGKEELTISKFDLVKCVSDTVKLIHPLAKQKGVELNLSAGESVLFINNDEDKISHIMQNLIGNAVKFTEKGEVNVNVCKEDNHFEILVRDTGIGIAEEQLPFIFDEFRQADGSTSRRFGGTGLGLALARKYAMMLGGSINVQSGLNKGSEFKLILPLKYLPDNMTVETNPPETSFFGVHAIPAQNLTVGKHSKTILLVEDNEPAIVQIGDFLEEAGYDVLVARNGEEALEIVSETIPDAMILDLMMPGIDGFEVLNEIRASERTETLPVLILSAKFLTKEELANLRQNNIYQIIRKGDVNAKQLVNTINKMVNGI
jgi:signal transduction histidine kinase/CheY-like chemotaxis protein/HAMP domain-containing protein